MSEFIDAAKPSEAIPRRHSFPENRTLRTSLKSEDRDMGIVADAIDTARQDGESWVSISRQLNLSIGKCREVFGSTIEWQRDCCLAARDDGFEAANDCDGMLHDVFELQLRGPDEELLQLSVDMQASGMEHVAQHTIVSWGDSLTDAVDPTEFAT